MAFYASGIESRNQGLPCYSKHSSISIIIQNLYHSSCRRMNHRYGRQTNSQSESHSSGRYNQPFNPRNLDNWRLQNSHIFLKVRGRGSFVYATYVKVLTSK